MGVNLILGTQMVLQGTTNTVQQRLTQAGLILCFKPASNRITLTAKMIEPGNEVKWVGTLATLGVGEFIALGTLEINHRAINYPLKVNGYLGNGEDFATTEPVDIKSVNGVVVRE